MTEIIRVRHVWTGTAGLPGVSTTYVDSGAGNAQLAVDAWGDFWTALDDLIANDFTVTLGGNMDHIEDTTGEILSVEAIDEVAIPMQASGQFLPLASQGLCQFLTGVFYSGRQLRGKMFVPGIVEDQNEVGVPTAGCIATFNGALDTLFGFGTGLTGIGRVWGPPVPEPARAGRSNHVSNAFFWDQWAVLRSRRD